jgi:transcriptional regulator with XRE-family HTH domain
LGLALRATRRSGKVRLDDLAQIAGVSKRFVSDVEYGKQTVQWGLVLKLLLEMGVFMSLEIPQEANAQVWEKVREWKVSFEASGVPGEQIDKVQTAFRHIDAISTGEMRKKLK